MALPDTNTLDIPSRGGPAEYPYVLTGSPVISTVTLDIPSRGGPATYMYTTVSSGGVTIQPSIMMLMGIG